MTTSLTKSRSHCLFTLEDASIDLLVECKVNGAGMSEQIQFAMQNWSIEFTPSNKTKIDDFRRVLPIGTTVNVTAIPGTDPALMMATVEQLATQEMNPVPRHACSLQAVSHDPSVIDLRDSGYIPYSFGERSQLLSRSSRRRNGPVA